MWVLNLRQVSYGVNVILVIVRCTVIYIHSLPRSHSSYSLCRGRTPLLPRSLSSFSLYRGRPPSMALETFSTNTTSGTGIREPCSTVVIQKKWKKH